MSTTAVTPDQEIQWLKEQSGLTDAELTAYQAVLGDSKFKSMLMKLQAANTQAAADRAAAEQERLNLEKKLTDEVYPELRRVTQDSVRAAGETARAKAELEQARQYGIVPGTVADDAARAPGSPVAATPPPADTSRFVSRDDFTGLRDEAGTAVALMNDLNAEHFKLFGSPVPNMSELVAEVKRERTLGHADADLRRVWETKHNIPAKRAEVAQAEKQKELDAYAGEKLKEYREKHGDNPATRVATQSRFSTYDPKGGKDDTKPWRRDHKSRVRNEGWRQDSAAKLEKALVH